MGSLLSHKPSWVWVADIMSERLHMQANKTSFTFSNASQLKYKVTTYVVITIYEVATSLAIAVRSGLTLAKPVVHH